MEWVNPPGCGETQTAYGQAVPKFLTSVAHRRFPEWEPTLTDIAHRANLLWHQDRCPLSSDLVYSIRSRQQLAAEHAQLVAATVSGTQEASRQRRDR